MASTGIDPRKIDELIDKISKLTTAMENGHIGGNGDNGEMFPYWRRGKNRQSQKTYDDLDKMERAYYREMREKRKQELDQEIQDLENAISQMKNARGRRGKKTVDELKAEEEIKEKRKEQKATKKSEEYYYDYKTRRVGSKAAWDSMSKEEKSVYGGKFSSFEREGNFRKKSAKRKEVSDRIYESGLGDTKAGRYAQSVLSRTERISEYGRIAGNMSDKLGGAASKMAGKGGKAASAAAKGLGVFSKGLGAASKLMGGPYVAAILMAIDAIKMLGEAMNEWKKATADMIEHQNKQEQLQYENAKQHMLIENEMKIENVSKEGDLQLKMLETQGETMMEALKISVGQYVKGVETALGPMTKGINQSAYDAAMYRVDAAADYEKLQLHKTQRETEQQRYKELRTFQNEGKIAGLTADIGVADTAYKTQMRQAALDYQQSMEKNHVYQNLVRDAENNLIQSDGTHINEDTSSGNTNVVTGQAFKNNYTDTKKAGIDNINNPNALGALAENWFGDQEGVHAKEQAWLHNANQVLTQAADYNKASTDAQYQLATTQKDYNNQILDKQLDIETEAAETVIDAAAEVKKMWLQLAQKTEQYLENFDSITNNLGISLGYTSKDQLRSYQKTMFNIVENVASKFGKDIEDVVKIQQGFAETTGRNRIMGESDYGQMLGLGKYLGDDGLAANYASEMEIFNVGVADSVDMLDNVLQDVNRIGLNGRKYTKTLVDSLKLAQKYNFKGGTENLMKMAKWAENTRFNMNSLGGMLDKVSEGGLEGVITQGAQFQVLGGHAAMNADPIAMMYERYADPEAFAKRMQDMTKGYGHIDRETGETNFAGNEIMMMEQLAKVQGRSVEDVMNEVRARNKREVVAKQFTSKFDEDQQSFISNNATYNKETGQFQVKVKRGNKYVDTDVSNLTAQDLENIMPESHNERMEKYMQDVLSAMEGVKGEEIAEKANTAAATYEEMLNAYAERTKMAHDSFAKHREEYIEETKKGMNEATKAFKDYIGIFDEGNKQVDEAVKGIESTANNIKAALDSTATIIQEANAKIASAAGVGYTKPKSNGELKPQSVANRSTSVAQAASQFMNKEMMWTMTNNGATGKSNFKALGKAIKGGKSDEIISAMGETGLWTHSMKHYLGKYGIDWGSLSDTDKVAIAKEFYNGITSSNTMKGQGNKEYWDASKNGWSDIKDGVAKANGNPMYAEASAITPITDGSVKIAKTHTDDTGIFAKNGGPFDTLFNDIFGKINSLYETFNGGGSGAHVSSDMRSVRNIEPLLSSKEDGSRESGFNGTIQLDTLKVEMSGNLELSSGGQSVDIMKELQSNPMLLRALSQMMAEHISQAMNGGRGTQRLNLGSI